MATMKVKNSAGEWVTASNAGLMGDMKVEVVRATDKYTFDLSQYVRKNSNFLFFFKNITNTSSPQSGGDLYVLEKIGATARKAYWNTNVAGMGWWDHISHVELTDLFPDGWKMEGTWDDEALTITFPAYGASTYGLLIYSDVNAEEA